MMLNDSKYKYQIKYLRDKYKRFSIDFKIDELETFKRICDLNNTTPTTEIKSFVRKYIDIHKNKL